MESANKNQTVSGSQQERPSKPQGFKVASLGSGSKGNATLVSNGNTSLLVDCGFSLKESLARFERLDFCPSQLDAILVTHEHQDHIRGAGALSRKFKIPVYSTQGTYLADRFGQLAQFERIKAFQDFAVGDFQITPISVPHDAREPCQFIIQYQQERLAIVSDLGSTTQPLIDQLSSCKTILLEMNHDWDMLQQGTYPYQLKQRVAGDFGHLNNQQAIGILQALESSSLELVVATHLSEQNNCPKLVESLLTKQLSKTKVDFHIAHQQQGFDWLTLAD